MPSRSDRSGTFSSKPLANRATDQPSATDHQRDVTRSPRFMLTRLVQLRLATDCQRSSGGRAIADLRGHVHATGLA